MPSIFRGAQAQVNRSDLSGRRVWKGAAAVANWWDPNNVGLSIAGAYRAINSIGTPWPGGPTTYLQTLVNLPFPGVNDLVEGAGGIPWVQATGWGFVAGFTQWLDTGLIPANDQSWSAFVQFANTANNGELFGVDNGFTRQFGIFPRPGGFVRYINGRNVDVAPVLLTGNLGMAGNQAYRNGVNEGGAMIGWGGASLRTIFIGARNVGVAASFITADCESIAIYNGGPAAVQAEAAVIAAAMATL